MSLLRRPGRAGGAAGPGRAGARGPGGRVEGSGGPRLGPPGGGGTWLTGCRMRSSPRSARTSPPSPRRHGSGSGTAPPARS
ncbi:hypothetical protein E1287_07165 [Actinomadura sp. KC06]|nr:hypothetical protein E1287_07165 [Actinomadura sp. KC06]